jgi:hypothetical protein
VIDGIVVWAGISSPIATALAMFYLVFTGRLIPRASHNDVVKVLQDRNAEVVTDRNNWQSAANLSNQTNADLAKSNTKLLETADFSTHVMSALQANAAGGSHVPS